MDIVGVNVTIMLSPTVSNAFNVTGVDVTGVVLSIIVGVNVPLTPPVFLHVTFTVNIQVPAIQTSELLSMTAFSLIPEGLRRNFRISAPASSASQDAGRS